MAILSTPSTTITTTTTQHHLSKLHHHHSTLSSITFPANNQQFSLTHISKSKLRTNVSFFTDFLNKPKNAESIKQELLEAIVPLDRGAEASLEDQQIIEQIVRKLEAANSTKEPLKSPLLDGKWELIYTTSQSILQTKRPKLLRSRVNYQAINADTLRAQNMESFPTFNQVTADLTPVSAKKVAVKFDYFKIFGLIPVKAPDTARGSLEITYLDEELRVSRGNKGNLFVLRMIDPSYRVPL
ncbi:probable plastid-lipid-associated protein 4, chloroplastic [Rutidosis leptorrhynchoides]|uniref:probable plastid-lipid-associated protein 4, chloroplastic n=1 Tax=Rutidosis leptorrhynchoides TaxID=125765 RepID=UPI003A991182